MAECVSDEGLVCEYVVTDCENPVTVTDICGDIKSTSPEVMEVDSKESSEAPDSHEPVSDITLSMPTWDEAIENGSTLPNTCMQEEISGLHEKDVSIESIDASILSVGQQNVPDSDDFVLVCSQRDKRMDNTVRGVIEEILKEMINKLDDGSALHASVDVDETIDASEHLEDITTILKTGNESEGQIEIEIVLDNDFEARIQEKELEEPIQEMGFDVVQECEANEVEFVVPSNDDDMIDLSVRQTKGQVSDPFEVRIVSVDETFASGVLNLGSDKIDNVANESVCDQNAIVTILVDTIENRDRKIVELEAEVRRLENEDDNLVIEEADSDVYSAIENGAVLIKKSAKIIDLKTTIKELEESLLRISVERDDLAQTLLTSQTDLSELRSASTKMETERNDALRTIEAARIENRDKDERISMLQIDVEYAGNLVAFEKEERERSINKLEDQIESLKDDVVAQKEINKNLRYNLKEEMKKSIRELKAVTESERDGLVKQIDILRNKEVDYLRRLDELRTTNDELARQTRDLRADAKTKNMEAEAYRTVAEKLKTIVAKLEKANVKSEQKIKDLQQQNISLFVNSAPEVITIDTDDQESSEEDVDLDDSDDEKCLENIRQFHKSLLNDLDTSSSSSNKRSQSNADADGGCVSKKLRLTSQSLKDAVATPSDIEVLDNSSVADGSLLNESEQDLATKSQEVIVQKDILEIQEVRIEKEFQTDDVPALDLEGQQDLLVRLQSEIAIVVNARNRLEPLLASLSEKLHLEKANVISLQDRLRQRAAIEENILKDQQTQFADLLERLKDVEAELGERNVAVHRLQAEKEVIEKLNSQLEGDVFEMTSKFNSITDSTQVLFKERDQLQERVSVLEFGQKGLQDLSDKNAQLSGKLSVALAEQKRLNGLLSTLEDESSRRVSTLEQCVTELEAKVTDAAAERSDLVAKLAQRQKEVEKIMDACKQTIVMADTERNNILQQCRETVEANERTSEKLRREVSKIAVVNVELLEQLSVLRTKLNEAEVNLSEKRAIVEVLRSEVDEYRRGQESMTNKIEKLCGEIDAAKKMLAETEKKLEMASKKRMAEQNTASTKKKHVLDLLKSKMASLDVDLSSSVDDRPDTLEKPVQMNGVENETGNEAAASVANEFEEFKDAYLEQKRRVDEIQSDILKDVSHFADLEKCKAEATDVRNKFWAEFHQLKEELKKADAMRESLRTELESLRSENVQEALESTQIRSMKMLTKRVEGLTNSENDLNRTISQLESDLLHHDSDALQNKVVNYMKVDLDDAQERLSKLAAAMAVHEVNATQESSVSDKMFSNNEQSILSKKISTLNDMVDSLKSNNEALQNRLNMALANGRRMETLLQSMQHSSSTKSTDLELKLQLEAAQNERDDLTRRLSESDNACMRLKVKVIKLAKTIRMMQGEENDAQDFHVMNLDDLDPLTNEASAFTRSRQQDSMTSTDKQSKVVEMRGGNVQLTTKLTQMCNSATCESNIAKENDVGELRRFVGKGQLQNVTSDEKIATTKRVDVKRLHPLAKKPLNTITNEAPHSSFVLVQENQGIQAIQHPAGSQTTEECNVQ